jgi:hypothetical protein
MPSRQVVRERLQPMVHGLTALTIFLKGLSKLEHPEGYWPFIIFLFAGSAVILALTVLHHRVHLSELVVHVTTYVIEAVTLGTVAYLYFGEGKRGLGVLSAVAAFGFVVACFIAWWKMGGPKPARHDVTAPRS